MSAKPSIGSFKIISLLEGNGPASVDDSRGPHPFIALQPVRLNEPVQLWRIREFKEEDDQTYRVRLAVGGYNYTGPDRDVVTASIYPTQDVEWIVTYREYNKAYTIALADDPGNGWTVPPIIPTNPVIEIRPIISTKSIPPQYSPTQLWHFIIPIEK